MRALSAVLGLLALTAGAAERTITCSRDVGYDLTWVDCNSGGQHGQMMLNNTILLSRLDDNYANITEL
jgi:hypothetical protein